MADYSNTSSRRYASNYHKKSFKYLKNQETVYILNILNKLFENTEELALDTVRKKVKEKQTEELIELLNR